MNRLCTRLLTPALLLAACTLAQAQTADNVLVVVNENSPDSVIIGDHYASVRGVPPPQVLRISTEVADEISRATFSREVETPISQWLRRNRAQDRILYLVLTKGIPLRVAGTRGRNGTLSSVDSELTLLYRKLIGATVPSGGRLPNPYFLADDDISEASLFSHEHQDIYLVTRLDGFTSDDVIALIDRGMEPASDGQILLDQKADPTSPADRWLADAATAVVQTQYNRVVLEATTRGATGEHEVLGYYSWESSDPSLLRRDLEIEFAPGAVGASYVGTSARTFTEPPVDWDVGFWSDRSTYYANTPESLTGDLIRAGITGAAGHVADPYLDGVIRPPQLFSAYLSGFNLAEAFYLAMPDLSWRTVVIGDPLVAPFPRAQLSSDLETPSTDETTQLPRFFSSRRLDQLVAEGADPAVASRLIHANWLLLNEERSAARTVLESVTELDNSSLAAHLLLGELYQDTDDDDLAVDRYRRVLGMNPNHVIALNNLAYLLMDRDGFLDEAFQLAQRAFTLVGGDAAIADTLGWIQHLRGNDREAVRYLAAAVQGLPDSANVRLHAAIVLHAIGQIERATTELAAAVELDPSLEDTLSVARLEAQLQPEAGTEKR